MTDPRFNSSLFILNKDISTPIKKVILARLSAFLHGNKSYRSYKMEIFFGIFACLIIFVIAMAIYDSVLKFKESKLRFHHEIAKNSSQQALHDSRRALLEEQVELERMKNALQLFQVRTRAEEIGVKVDTSAPNETLLAEIEKKLEEIKQYESLLVSKSATFDEAIASSERKAPINKNQKVRLPKGGAARL